MRKTVSSTRVCGSRRPWHGLDATTPARTAALNPPDKNPCLFEMALPLPLSCFTHRATVAPVTAEIGIDPKHRIHVACDKGAVARDSGRLHTGQAVDVAVQPLGNRRNVTTNLVELDDAQRLIGTVVVQKSLETLRGREALEGQRRLHDRLIRLDIEDATQRATDV